MCDFVSGDPDQHKGEMVLVLAGAPRCEDEYSLDVDTLLGLLLDEMPLKQAAALTARITGQKRNRLYRRALELADG